MENDLFIPTKLKVGFIEDSSTFTGKLAYVIYYDEKGKIRKEPSWNNWRDHKIEAIELDNTPMLGYMLNRGVERYGYHGSGRSMIRIHDPRDFEFEISIDNLVGILMNNDVSKRDIQGECVFAWSGSDLILLPVNSEEYKTSQKYTEKQSGKVSTKELIKGATYVKKKDHTHYRYLGHFEWFDYTEKTSLKQTVSKGKKHLFYTDVQKRDDNYHLIDEYEIVIAPMNTSLLSECVAPDVDQNYPNVKKQFEDSVNSAEFTGFREELITADDLRKKDNGWYHRDSAKSFCLKFGENTMYHLDFSMYYHQDKDHFEYRHEHFFSVYPMIKDGNNYKNTMVKDRYNDEKYLTEQSIIGKIFRNKSQLNREEFAAALNENGFRKIIRTRSDGVIDTLYP
jgi:hypothetical protein